MVAHPHRNREFADGFMRLIAVTTPAEMAGRPGVLPARHWPVDPGLVRKVRAGAAATVRPCVLCNQTCQVRDPRNPVVSCVGEPSSGHETGDAPVAGGASRPQRVLASIADWLAGECSRLGVKLELGRELGVEDIEAHDGAVLICTGSRDGRRDYRVEAGADIRTARSVVETAGTGSDGALPRGPVVVWDPIGGPIGISAAELLAPGRRVALVTHDLIAGTQLARSGDLADASTRLQLILGRRAQIAYPELVCGIAQRVFTVTDQEPKAGMRRWVHAERKRAGVRLRDLAKDGWTGWRTFG